jgi:hypothetical protein
MHLRANHVKDERYDNVALFRGKSFSRPEYLRESGFFLMFSLRFFLMGTLALALPLNRANAVSQTINLQANVSKYCTIGGSGTDNVTVPVLNGDVDTTEIDKSYSVVCNSAANVSLASANGAMVQSPSITVPQFDAFINYQVDMSGFATVSGTTSNLGPQSLGSTVTAGPENTSMVVKITPVSNSNPLAGGQYNDTLTISISPIP